jgi:hypothetical protein
MRYASQDRSRYNQPTTKLLPTLQKTNCESGGIGRRTRLRIWRVKPWGFESPLSHQSLQFVHLTSLVALCLRASAVVDRTKQKGSRPGKVAWSPGDGNIMSDHPKMLPRVVKVC